MKKILLMALVICMFVGVGTASALEVKQGIFINTKDGENSYITAVNLYKALDSKKLEFDFWVSDIDKILSKETDYKVGLAVAYRLGRPSDYAKFIKKIPVIKNLDRLLDVSAGYGVGLEELFTHNQEVKDGFYVVSTFKF